MSEKYWEITQHVLQSEDDPLVKRPRLTEELLRRPPFRFLHDVVSAVQRETEFVQGLFTETEKNVRLLAKDKEAKFTYLRKLIRAVSLASDTVLEVDPGNVLAGLEPEQTNKLLQVLGTVARSGIRDDIVVRVLQEEENESQEILPDRERIRPPSRPSSERNQNVVTEVEVTEDRNCNVLCISHSSEAEPDVLELAVPLEVEVASTSFIPPHKDDATSADVLVNVDPPENEEIPVDVQWPPQKESRVSRPSSRSHSVRPQSARKAPPSRPDTTASLHTREQLSSQRPPTSEISKFEETQIVGEEINSRQIASTLTPPTTEPINEFIELENTLHRVCQMLVPLGNCLESLEHVSELFTKEQTRSQYREIRTTFRRTGGRD
eukprot:g3014.t1